MPVSTGPGRHESEKHTQDPQVEAIGDKHARPGLVSRVPFNITFGTVT